MKKQRIILSYKIKINCLNNINIKNTNIKLFPIPFTNYS